MSWADRTAAVHALLGELTVQDRSGRGLGVDAAFEAWCGLALGVRSARRWVYLIGNGASASMASHFAADLAKNAGLRAEVFSDLSLITAISNDLGYEQVFAEPLRRRGEPGDLLVAISSSGRSPNILAATAVARERGLSVVTLSAMQSDNPLRRQGDINAYVPAATYGLAETCHAAILHHWMDMLESRTR